MILDRRMKADDNNLRCHCRTTPYFLPPAISSEVPPPKFGYLPRVNTAATQDLVSMLSRESEQKPDNCTAGPTQHLLTKWCRASAAHIRDTAGIT